MFGNLDIKTRPIRLAYLVEPNDANQVRDSIRISSTLWGGLTFPIIPLYSSRLPATWKDGPLQLPSAKKVIQGYLEAFDSDVFVQLSKNVPEFVRELGREIIRPEEIWRNLSEGGRMSLSPRFGIGIFEILNDIFDRYFKYKAKYPVRVVIPRIPRELSLFWASFFGEVPSNISAILEKRYLEPLEIQMPTVRPEHLLDLLKGDALFPRRLTQHDLEYRNLPGFGRDACVFFMDARKTEDIVDFWNLRALGRKVLPLPKQLEADPSLKEIIISFLRLHRRPWPHNPRVCDHASFIRSRNRTMEDMQQCAALYRIDRDPNDPSDSPFYSLQHWYPRIWNEWARDKDGATPADVYGDEESVEIAETSERKIVFTPILPKFAEKYCHHNEPRCANEIALRLYGETEFLAEIFPSSNGEKLSRAISGLTSLRGVWRVGRHGLVKLVTDCFRETRDIPASEDIFFAWLADHGWTSKLSTPGLLAKQIHRLLEGTPQYMLRHEKVLGLLEHMNGGLVRADGSPVDENRFVHERDMAIGEVKSRVGSQPLYEYLLSKNIFKLGSRVQCPHCLRNSWFPLDNIDDLLTCPRCLNDFSAIGNLDSSTWSYKTTGPFSLPNYADGAYAVLLTLKFFDDHKMHTMQTTSVVGFTAETPQKKNLEADFGCLWQESLYGEKKDGVMFGECKTYGRFEKRDFDRMQYIAKTFPGAVLVFSTLRKNLTPSEIAAIKRIAKTGRKHWKTERPINPVLILTGTELLNQHGPPYCWDEPNKTKYSRVTGLLGLCDISQQIYLGLQSWQTDWDERWKKQLQRRRSIRNEEQHNA